MLWEVNCCTVVALLNYKTNHKKLVYFLNVDYLFLLF